VSSLGQNRFSSGWVHVYLSKFGSGYRVGSDFDSPTIVGLAHWAKVF